MLVNELMAAARQVRMHYDPGKRGHKEGIGFVLRYLYQQREPVSPGQIAEKMQTSLPRVTAVLNNMEEKNLIYREHSATDRRRVCVCLTEEGRRALEENREQKRRMAESFVERVGEEDAETFLRILKGSL